MKKIGQNGENQSCRLRLIHINHCRQFEVSLSVVNYLAAHSRRESPASFWGYVVIEACAALDGFAKNGFLTCFEFIFCCSIFLSVKIEFSLLHVGVVGGSFVLALRAGRCAVIGHQGSHRFVFLRINQQILY